MKKQTSNNLQHVSLVLPTFLWKMQTFHVIFGPFKIDAPENLQSPQVWAIAEQAEQMEVAAGEVHTTCCGCVVLPKCCPKKRITWMRNDLMETWNITMVFQDVSSIFYYLCPLFNCRWYLYVILFMPTVEPILSWRWKQREVFVKEGDEDEDLILIEEGVAIATWTQTEKTGGDFGKENRSLYDLWERCRLWLWLELPIFENFGYFDATWNFSIYTMSALYSNILQTWTHNNCFQSCWGC